MLRETLNAIERNERLDRIAAPLRAVLRPIVAPRAVRNALSGAWLGHRLHPLLTDVAIGTLSSATLLDLAGGRAAEGGADLLARVGVAAALPTAAAGANDWVDLGGPNTGAARLGVVHAAANTVALGLYAGSLAARTRGDRTVARALSVCGLGAMAAGGYLGGHLSFARGAGVSHTAFEHGPDDWTRAVPLAELPERAPYAAQADGRPVLVYREGDVIRAIADTCSHAGCSLARGEVQDGAVTCSCHGSSFRLDDGAVLRGPAATPQTVFETRVQAGVVEVREALD